jgi:plasmid stabilization system protein ParE
LSRFTLSPSASSDLEEIDSYLRGVPIEPANRTAHLLQKGLRAVGDAPMQGMGQSELSRILGVEVKSRSAPPYRIFYRLGGRYPEVIAILHSARDIPSILRQRFQ